MKLKEKVFLCELVKANYRRRMFWFWVQVLVMVICLACLSYLVLNDLKSDMIALISVVGIIATILSMSHLYLSAFSLGFPWKVKREQSETLEEIWKTVDFEDLRGYVYLNEYLRV
jgi:hypothetical protein